MGIAGKLLGFGLEVYLQFPNAFDLRARDTEIYPRSYQDARIFHHKSTRPQNRSRFSSDRLSQNDSKNAADSSQHQDASSSLNHLHTIVHINLGTRRNR